LGFFRKLFGLRDPADDVLGPLMNSINRNAFLATAPDDNELWQQAEKNAGHISMKAVSDEYQRLLLQKHRIS
jgi:hypothetical protein